MDGAHLHGMMAGNMDAGDEEDTIEYADPAQAQTTKYRIKFEQAQCSLQQVASSYQSMYDNGNDLDALIEWGNPNNGSNDGSTANILLDDLGLCIDFEESYIKITLDFTDLLVGLWGILTAKAGPTPTYKVVALWDQPDTTAYLDSQGTPSVKVPAMSEIGVVVDNNLIDHMFTAKRFALGINDNQIQAYNRAELLILCEQKRRGEDNVGRTARAAVEKMYPLYCDNITKWRGPWRMDDIKNRLWLQSVDGRVFKRLSLGPQPASWAATSTVADLKLIAQNQRCVETVFIPFKWFAETAYAKVDTPIPQRLPVKFESTIGGYGDVYRFVQLPGNYAWSPADMNIIPNNPTNPGNTFPLHPQDWTQATALTDLLQPNEANNLVWPPTAAQRAMSRGLDTFDRAAPLGAAGAIQDYGPNRVGLSDRFNLWNLDVSVRDCISDPRYLFYLGEYGHPVQEISTNPYGFRNFSNRQLMTDDDAKKIKALADTRIWAKGLFRFKVKNPTSDTRAKQAGYYTDGINETTCMRVDLTKFIKATWPIEVPAGSVVVGSYDYLPTGQSGASNSQVDTCDYYKIFIVEDSVGSLDKQSMKGVVSLQDIKAYARFCEELVNNPWRTGKHVFVGDRLEWRIVQTTSKDHGTGGNRTGYVEMGSLDDWFYTPVDYMENVHIPSKTMSGYFTKGSVATSTPARVFIPHIMISAQFDASYKTYSGYPPSKPRTPHIAAFKLICNTALPIPTQPTQVLRDPNVSTSGVVSCPGATGYRIIILSRTTVSAFIFSNSSVDVITSEEVV